MRRTFPAIWKVAALALALSSTACDRAPTSPTGIDGPMFAATRFFVEDKIPIPLFIAFIPCAAGGAGELAVVTGAELHVVLRTVIDADSGFHSSGHFQPIRNWDGIGTVTGDIYQATGVTRNNINVDGDGLPFESTFVNNFRWIGPGTGNNLLVHATIHLTINANGSLTADVFNASVDCK